MQRTASWRSWKIL